MSSFSLKWLALVTMIIDHIGAVFFPDMLWIRCIGRISFPIYAFLLTQGFIHTNSRKKYCLRLAGFALLSEIPYDLVFYQKIIEFDHQNILFELLCGFLVLSCLEKAVEKKKYIFYAPIPFLIFASAYLGLSYGIYGIALIIFYWLCRNNVSASAVSSALVTWTFNGIAKIKLLVLGRSTTILSLNTTQLYAVSAAIPIFLYNGQKGKHSLKWLFYVIYPAHLLVIFAIRALITV